MWAFHHLLKFVICPVCWLPTQWACKYRIKLTMATSFRLDFFLFFFFSAVFIFWKKKKKVQIKWCKNFVGSGMIANAITHRDWAKTIMDQIHRHEMFHVGCATTSCLVSTLCHWQEGLCADEDQLNRQTNRNCKLILFFWLKGNAGGFMVVFFFFLKCRIESSYSVLEPEIFFLVEFVSEQTICLPFWEEIKFW